MTVQTALTELRQAATSPAASRAVRTLEHELDAHPAPGGATKPAEPSFPRDEATRLLGGTTTDARGTSHSQ